MNPRKPAAHARPHRPPRRTSETPGLRSTRTRLGASAVYSDGQYLYGDEANQNAKTSDFTVVNVSSSYQVTPKVQIYGAVENLFDEDYETFGTFSPVDEVPIAEVPGISNPRSLSPAAPRAIYAGLRLRF